MTITQSRPIGAVTTPAARAPLGAAKSAFVAAVLALVLIAIGALGIRDAAVAAGWLRGDLLLPNAFDGISEIGPQPWMVPAGLAVAVLGIVLAVVALLPRRPVAVALDADTAVYVGHGDVARVASAAALDVPGVLSATSTASSRRVVVRCRATGSGDDVRALVADAVGDALAPLRHTPRIAVRVRQEDRS